MKTFLIRQSITNRDCASINMYFKEVRKFEQLTQEEEIELSKRIMQGDEQAVQKLVMSNLRFVISVAKQYQGKGVDLIDLIQEGTLGCCEAARKYDYTKGYKFITYAVWWIRQAIIKALSDNCRTVRIPVNQLLNINTVNKASRKFETENGYAPSSNDIEDSTNIGHKKVKTALMANYDASSLEAPLKDVDNKLIDVLPNENAELPDDDLYKEDIKQEANEILASLSDRDCDVVRMTFGIGVQAMCGEEIAARFGVSAERIRQLQHSIIDELRKKYKNKISTLL